MRQLIERINQFKPKLEPLSTPVVNLHTLSETPTEGDLSSSDDGFMKVGGHDQVLQT